MREQDSTKLEFLMRVNDNIIVQRFFNVRDFNPHAKYSLDLYEFISDFKDIFTEQLKMKTVSYMLENAYEIGTNPELLNTSFTDGPEHFHIFIKQGDTTICHRLIDAKIYPPKIRYTVDIRPHIKSLLSSLTDIFSDKNLTYEYDGISLKPSYL
jgi:hypothetical protein